jgi:hypothetical protein
MLVSFNLLKIFIKSLVGYADSAPKLRFRAVLHYNLNLLLKNDRNLRDIVNLRICLIEQKYKCKV